MQVHAKFSLIGQREVGEKLSTSFNRHIHVKLK